jgi:hypothetical protein
MAERGRVIPFPRPARGASGGADSLMEVHRCDQPEAMVVKGLFESEGIPLLLHSRLAHSVHPFTVGAQGEVVILVPPSVAKRAALLLARMMSRKTSG